LVGALHFELDLEDVLMMQKTHFHDRLALGKRHPNYFSRRNTRGVGTQACHLELDLKGCFSDKKEPFESRLPFLKCHLCYCRKRPRLGHPLAFTAIDPGLDFERFRVHLERLLMS
jgi:hypothetical protein